jgi:hypothetical protein
MKKRPLTYTVLAAAAMISLGVGASLAQGGNAGGGGGTGGGGGGLTDPVPAPPPPPPVVDPVVVPPVDPNAVTPQQAPPPAPTPPPAPLPSADLQLTGRASTGSPTPGSTYSFNYTIKNSGTGTATDVVFSSVTPILYTGATLNGQQLTGCTAQGILTGGDTLVCTIPTLAKGASANIVIMSTAPQAAATVASTATVGSDKIIDPNPANNSASASITVKAPSGSVCKGGTCDLVPSVQAAPCAALTAVSAPVGYYLTYAAIWNVFTLQSCSSSSETVSVQVQELNQLTGLVDYDVTWYVALVPGQNYSMVLDNDFAPNDTPYTISYTVRDSSGNQLDTSSVAAVTPPPN